MTGWNRVQWQTCPPSSSITSSLRGNIQKVSVSLAGTCYSVQRQTSWVQRFHPAAWIILQPLASTTAVSHSQRLGSEKLPNGSKKPHSPTQIRWFFWSEEDIRNLESGIWNLLDMFLFWLKMMYMRDIDEGSEVIILSAQENKIEFLKGQNNNNRTFGDNQNWHQLFIIFH